VAEFVYNPRFPGQYYDAETGLNYNYFRDYDPATGRYIESDPIGIYGGPSTYAYVDGDPLGLVDPTGLDSNLGDGYTGRVDQFNYGGESSFEIHVFDKNGNEVGIYGPNGWIARHGYNEARPAGVSQGVENACKGIAVDRLRASGHLPPKGRLNIKWGRWMRRLLQWLPLIDAYEEETEPSPQLACDIAPFSNACLDTK
jgi:RHS repeat-associated protein